MSKEKIFADGFSFSTRENQPDFVVGRVSVKVEDAIPFLKEHGKKRGWVNLNILTGRSGKPYIELDTWEAKSDTNKPAPARTVEEDLPF
jgi:hypothetical protein|tara:strand:+ start:2479 stop:2745 length:267 start_codon:yes stop_codon:yes gene_type:complete